MPHRPLLQGLLLCASVGLLAQDAMDPGFTTPTASQSISLKAGQVDAISGTLNISIPLGPRLPGRIPIGFSLHFDSQERSGVGGQFRPVMWIPDETNHLSTKILVGSQSYVFYTQASPTDATLLTNATQLKKWILDRGVVGPDFARSEAEASLAAGDIEAIGAFRISAIPSSDGTKFLVTSYWDTTFSYENPRTGAIEIMHGAAGYRQAVIDGADVLPVN